MFQLLVSGTQTVMLVKSFKMLVSYTWDLNDSEFRSFKVKFSEFQTNIDHIWMHLM